MGSVVDAVSDFVDDTVDSVQNFFSPPSVDVAQPDFANFNAAASSSSLQADNEGRKVTVKQAIPQRRFIYGRALASGPMFFLELNNPHLYMGILLSDGPIDAVEEVRIGETTVRFDANGNATTFPYLDAGVVYFSISVRNGTDDQAIDPLLAADWPDLPTTFRQRGIATIVLKMHYGIDRDHHETLWPTGSISPVMLTRGLKLYDPRNVFHTFSDKGTWEWSDNSTLSELHYVTNKWRRPVDLTDVNIESIKVAANIDDQSVGLKSGSTEKRYTANGLVQADQTDAAVLSRMLTANNGDIAFREGKFDFRSAGPIASSLTLDDDDIKGSITTRHGSPDRELINKIRTRFTAPDRKWQLGDGPIIENAAFVAADGKINDSTAEQPFNNSASRAQRIGKQIMESTRRGKIIQTTLGDISQILLANDVVTLDLRTLPHLNGLYTVKSVEDGDQPGRVILREYADEIFAWDPDVDEQDFTISPASL